MKAIVKKDPVTSINATKVGSPSLSDFVASGFSTSNYYKVTGGSAVPASNLNSFEIVCKIKTPSSWTSNGRVINPTNGADSTTAPYVEVTTGSASLWFYNGSSYTASTALTNVASNTTYWLKWIYNGSTIKSYYSTNGKDYTLNAENTPPYKPFFNSSEFGVGCRTSDGASVCVWNGSVDLNELKITLNGSLWLSGTKTVVVDKVYAVEKSINVDYNEQPTLINANGVVTSSTGGNGWVIYQQDQYHELYLALNTAIKPDFPRWQTGSYPATAYFKTPNKGIMTYYTSKQTVDDNGSLTSRVCTHWILKGYESEENCLAGIGGLVLDEYIVPSISIGSTVTRTLSNTTPFQYYSLTMVNNHGKDGSYTSMGETRFYMRVYNPHTVKKFFMAR